MQATVDQPSLFIIGHLGARDIGQAVVAGVTWPLPSRVPGAGVLFV